MFKRKVPLSFAILGLITSTVVLSTGDPFFNENLPPVWWVGMTNIIAVIGVYLIVGEKSDYA